MRQQILISFLFSLVFIVVGTDFACIQGRNAQMLSLPGSGIVYYLPWVAAILFCVGIHFVLKAKGRWQKAIGFIALYVLCGFIITLPCYIFDLYSAKIPVPDFLSQETIESFQSHFQTPTVHYSSSSDGTVVAVPKSKYNETMPAFLSKTVSNQPCLSDPNREKSNDK